MRARVIRVALCHMPFQRECGNGTNTQVVWLCRPVVSEVRHSQLDVACVCVDLHVCIGVRHRQDRREYQRNLGCFHAVELIAVKRSKGCMLNFLQALIMWCRD